MQCVVLNAKNDARGGGDHRRGRRVRRGHGVHADGRARHRHPPRRHDSRRTTTRSPSWAGCYVIGTGAVPVSRGWTTSCAAGRAGRATPAARSCSRQLADDQVVQYAPDATAGDEPDDDGRARRPDDAAVRGPRAAGRRGRAAGDPPQHLALHPADRAPAQGAAGAPRRGAARPIWRRRSWRRARRSGGRRSRRRSTTRCSSEAARQIVLFHLDQRGPTTWRSSRTCASASTCARSAQGDPDRRVPPHRDPRVPQDLRRDRRRGPRTR